MLIEEYSFSVRPSLSFLEELVMHALYVYKCDYTVGSYCST